MLDLPKIITSADEDRREFLHRSFRASFFFGSILYFPSVLFSDEIQKNQPSVREEKKQADKIIKVERHGQVYSVPIADSNNKIIPDGYDFLSRIFGDFQAGQAVSMDVRLFGILFSAQDILRKSGYDKPYYLTSGYRTIQTNANTEGAALHSKHPEGRAFDGIFPGLKPIETGRLLRYCGANGVGIYKNFCHADTGRVRAWYG